MTASPEELASQRTDWAEDRTILANERTYAGWLRTGLGAVGVGLGFQAIFRAVEPIWLAKAAATLFVLIGCFIFWRAYRNACAVLNRLKVHSAEPVASRNIGMLSTALIAGSLTLVAAFWIL